MNKDILFFIGAGADFSNWMKNCPRRVGKKLIQ
jgi:hypothetical protein